MIEASAVNKRKSTSLEEKRAREVRMGIALIDRMFRMSELFVQNATSWVARFEENCQDIIQEPLALRNNRDFSPKDVLAGLP